MIDPLVALRPAMQAVAKVHGPTLNREADFEKALSEELASDLQTQRQFPLQLDGWSGRLGNVDIALTLPGEQLVLMELKWGGQDALAACAWDSVKLATAQAEGKTSRALLCAAAPRATWDRSLEGTEFFTTQDWELESVLHRYEGWFEFWRRDVKNYPRVVAARWSTVLLPIDDTEFEWDGEPWELRASEISAGDDSLQPIWFVPRIKPKRGKNAEYIEEPDPRVEDEIARRHNPQRR